MRLDRSGFREVNRYGSKAQKTVSHDRRDPTASLVDKDGADRGHRRSLTGQGALGGEECLNHSCSWDAVLIEKDDVRRARGESLANAGILRRCYSRVFTLRLVMERDLALGREQFPFGYEVIDRSIVDDENDIDLILQASNQTLNCVPVWPVKDNDCGYHITLHGIGSEDKLHQVRGVPL